MADPRPKPTEPPVTDLIDKFPNVYGFGGLDRSAHLRARESWLEELLARPDTRLVPVWRRAENAAEKRRQAATQGIALALILAATLSLFVAPIVLTLLAVLKRTEATIDRPRRPAAIAMRIAA